MPDQPTPSQLGAYLSWLYSAIVPVHSGQADRLLHENELSIHFVAGFLRGRLGLPPTQRLYRGVLLQEEDAAGGVLKPKPQLGYLSFSECRHAALTFADPRDPMAIGFRAHGIAVEGYLIEHEPSPDEILYHWSWSFFLKLHTRPLVSEETLMEQKEVILAQRNLDFPITPVNWDSR